LIVEYPGPASPIADIRASLVAGHGAAAGIYSSPANASAGVMTLGYGEASDLLHLTGGQTATFAGQTVDATSVLVRYTRTGDADLNGWIDADDYFAIDSNYNKSGTVIGYDKGDFDYNGLINGDDYFWIDANALASAPAAASLAVVGPGAGVGFMLPPVRFGGATGGWTEEFLGML
jgi:hypothetical protein